MSRTICYACFRPHSYCFCQKINPFQTEVEFIILMHPMEAYKEKLGTGRIAHSFLKNSQIKIGINFENDPQMQNWLSDETVENRVLYPGVGALAVEDQSASRGSIKKPLRLFVIDGTWPCARKMMNQNPALKNLPRFTFSGSYRSRFLIKQQPGSVCLSTIESLHKFIELWEGESHDAMLEVLDELVQIHLDIAADPNREGYRKKPYKGVLARKSQRRKRKIFA
ncbi:MAG: DTW domain-containing protein [Halobacteriovoraceae bacterium]|nr:DTW domain-containing protein [Halobacteriovoraceae bacterium]